MASHRTVITATAHGELVVAAGSSQTVSEPACGLVGRDTDLARLRALVARLAAGQGGLIWVAGEPGIGKSALLREGLAAAPGQGWKLFAAQADESSAWFPLRVPLDALQVGPHSVDPGRAEIAGLLWPDGFPAVDAPGAVTPGDVISEATERLLTLVGRLCAVGPVVLAVDDLQWADGASLAVLGRLGRLVEHLPLLLVAASRPVPVRAEVEGLGRCFTAHGTRLDLTALTDDAVREFMERMVGAAVGPRLYEQARQAGGNPSYLAELVGALVREHRLEVTAGVADLAGAEVAPPVSLTAAISRRLGFLTGNTTTLLRMAALLGVQFDIEHLAMLRTQNASELVEAVQEAVAAGVVIESGPGLAFRHTLIREALYQGMPAGLRAALHRQAAQASAVAGAAVERVAEQLLAASQTTDSWVAQWLAEAAPVLIDRAPRAAVELLTRVRGTVGVEGEGRDLLDAHLADALLRLGDLEQVEQVAGPALGHARDPALVGRLTWTLGYALLRLTRYEHAREIIRRMVAERPLTPVWAARLTALRAAVLSACGHDDQAQALATQAEADGHKVGDRLAVGYALYVFTEIFQRRRQSPCLEEIDRALTVIGEDAETADLRLMLLGSRAAALGSLGRLDEAERVIGQALSLAESAGLPTRLAQLRVQAAEHCFYAGRWDDAVAEMDAAAELPLDVGPQLWLRGLSALIAVHRDERAAAAGHLSHIDATPLAAGETGQHAEPMLVAQALAAERGGQPTRALALLSALFDPKSTLDFQSPTQYSPLWLPDVVRLSLAVGQTLTAKAAATACADEAARQRLPHSRASALHCQGLITADPAVVRSGADAYRDVGYVLFQAHALEDAAVLLAERGNSGPARAAFDHAQRIYGRLDAAWDIRRADTRLRPLGIRRGVHGPRRRRAFGWEALTSTELKIADMVAAGCSNHDIATELFLSYATVSTHISHILRKLDAHSRVDIAREATNRRRS